MEKKVDPVLASVFLSHFETQDHLKDWVHNFLGLDLPDSYVDPDSNSSPIGWMWEVYKGYKENAGNKMPSIITVSSRESYKCVEKGTVLISKERGLVPIENITAGEVIWTGFSWQPVTHWIHDGIKDGVKLTTDNGLTLTTSPVHKVWAWRNSSGPEWIKVSDLKDTDYVQWNSVKDDFSLNFVDFQSGYGKAMGLTYESDLGITNITKSYAAGFISGVFKTSGRILGLCMEMRLPSRKVADNVQLLLSWLGVKSNFYANENLITVNQEDIKDLFSANVKLGPYKADDFLSENQKTDESDVKSKWVKVKSVEKVSNVDFYDLTVDKDHSYWSRGIVSHNTLTESILSVILMVHFNATICHMAAIVPQATAAQKYLSSWMMKIEPYLLHHNKIPHSENAKEISIKNTDGSLSWMKIVVCSISGSNSSHSNILCVSGKTKILIKNPDAESNLPYISVSASKLFKKLNYGTAAEAVSFNHATKNIEFKPITKWFNTGKKDGIDIIFSDGGSTTTSKDHKFYTEDGYLEAGSILNKTISKLSHGKLKKTKVIKIEDSSYNGDYYDFTVEDNNNFFANSVLVHNCIDEVDTIRSAEQRRAYKEAQFIPGVFDGQHPMTIKTSTMKFPGGLFSKEIDLSAAKNWPVFKWNIIDITEYCPPERHLPNGPTETKYIAYNLPLRTLSQEQYGFLSTKEQEAFTKIEAMAGCAKCPLLPVCKGALSRRPSTNVGGLWKPIDFTISQFDKQDADLSEAQLLCRKPSSQGMVYPRFLNSTKDGNVLTLVQAYETLTGDKPNKDFELNDLIALMHTKGIRFYVSGDWGFVHNQAFVVSAIMPNGDWWIVDAYSIPGLEFDQVLDEAKRLRDIYKPKKWFMDTAEPQNIKTFNKNRMPCADFKKDVQGGISSVRTQIVDAKNRRRLKVIKTDRTEIVLKMFAEHCFLLDTIGNVTQHPDDGELADIADSLRYAGQNLFKPRKSTQDVATTKPSQTLPALNTAYEDIMTQKVRSLAIEDEMTANSNILDFGDDD